MTYRDRRRRTVAPLDDPLPAVPGLPDRSPHCVDAEAEASVLLQLAERAAAAPEQLLKDVATSALALCEAASAGVSLIDAGGDSVRCQVACGRMASLEGAESALHDHPCRPLFEHRSAQLLSRPARQFAMFAAFDPPPEEVLLVPMFEDEVPVGALWAATHGSDARPFDLEHARLLSNLARVAAAGLRRGMLREQPLRDSEAHFLAIFEELRLALEASHLSLWESDLNGRPMAWSSALFELATASRDSFDPGIDALSRCVHPDDAYIVDAALQRAAHGQPFQIEYRIIRPDGQVRWVAKHGRVIRDREGRPQRAIGTVADITARKIFEEELRRVRDDLESNVHERTLELAQAIASLRREVNERSSAEQRVRSLLGRLVGAVEDERHRISRDLHDTLGQHLSVLTFGLQTLAHDDTTAPAMRQRIAGLLQAAQHMEDEVDRISHELRPLALDELGLDDALRRHAQAWSNESGVAIDLHTSGLRRGLLAPTVESTVYRVVQEALTNVRKHARAQHVSLIAERRADEIRLIVEDDGKGFDPGAIAPQADDRGSLGLKGMNERAALVGGQLQIESTPEVGTTIYLTIPLDRDPGNGPAIVSDDLHG